MTLFRLEIIVSNVAMNLALKMAILGARKTQTEIAKETGIHESRLSRIVRGHDAASDDERKRLAAALRSSERDLFRKAS